MPKGIQLNMSKKFNTLKILCGILPLDTKFNAIMALQIRDFEKTGKYRRFPKASENRAKGRSVYLMATARSALNWPCAPAERLDFAKRRDPIGCYPHLAWSSRSARLAQQAPDRLPLGCRSADLLGGATHPNTLKYTDNATPRPIFPFTAIVGQEEMKLSLILNVIDPKIGGVMIMGDRGTGKSTAVRALVDLLPEITVVSDDPFNSDPEDPEAMSDFVREKLKNNESLSINKKKISMIDLPLGATEDRVCGTIDLEKALTEGIKAFEPGLLAQANRGILYVDEVNLLDDHLVDVLLDAAASGWNTVEREGISISHPARFILIGSGNPEEGELRPQLLDRFGLHAQIGTVQDPELRVQIVEQRAAFDEEPILFRQKYKDQQRKLTQLLLYARENLHKVQISSDLRIKISQVCATLDIDGLRGDIVTNRAAKALTSFEKREQVTSEDILRVIPLCLRHRLRKDPLETIDSGEKVRETFQEIF